MIRWGIIGPGAIAHNFATGLAEISGGKLTAIASRNADRRAGFGKEFGIPAPMQFEDYETLAASDAVDAIYVSTLHPTHAEHAQLAMRHGKGVLCEKPAGLTHREVLASITCAAAQNVLFMEAFMYRAHPQIARLLDLIAQGRIGTPRHVSSSFGFVAPPDPESRLYSPQKAGGAILDVGCYPVSLSRLIAGVVSGAGAMDPVALSATAQMTETGVDGSSHALLRFANGMTAECACSVTREMANTATIYGDAGEITLCNPWMPGRETGPSDADILITNDGVREVETIRSPRQLFSFEAELASALVADGAIEAPAPAMSWADSLGNAITLDRWRHAVGYLLPADTA